MLTLRCPAPRCPIEDAGAAGKDFGAMNARVAVRSTERLGDVEDLTVVAGRPLRHCWL
jgi:hypothetical protein